MSFNFSIGGGGGWGPNPGAGNNNNPWSAWQPTNVPQGFESWGNPQFQQPAWGGPPQWGGQSSGFSQGGFGGPWQNQGFNQGGQGGPWQGQNQGQNQGWGPWQNPNVNPSPPNPGWGNWGARRRGSQDGGNGGQQNDVSGGSFSGKTYAIVVKNSTNQEWSSVAETLKAKYPQYAPKVYIYESDVTEVVPRLKEDLPYYTCFIAGPVENTREYLKTVHKITRGLTPGPYYDTIWGILTGPDQNCTNRIAKISDPLKIRRAISNTSLNYDKIVEGTMYSESDEGQCNEKVCGNPKFVKGTCGADLSEIFAYELANKNNKKRPVDLIVSSAHATEHNWQIGYKYNAGYFVHDGNNTLQALHIGGGRENIESPNPKVLVAAGNCLMGHVVQGGCMALSWMNSANVAQMVGYTVESWFGYGGWGILKYFVDLGGMLNLSESFFANMQSLIRLLNKPEKIRNIPNFEKGLQYDEYVMAFYGDPAWDARIESPSEQNGTVPNKYVTEFEQVGPKSYRMKVTMTQDGDWDCEKGNDNWTQPGRPPIFIFPRRMRNARVVSGNIILTPLFAFFEVEGKVSAGTVYEAVFEEQY